MERNGTKMRKGNALRQKMKGLREVLKMREKIEAGKIIKRKGREKGKQTL